MRGVVLGTLALLMRRLFDVLRGIDMAIWGLIFVRAVGLGPLAGVLAIIMQDTGLLGRLYAEGHEAVDRSPGRGLTAVGANGLQKHRFGIFTQSFPTFLALSLYQIESTPAPRRCWASSAPAVSGLSMPRICVCGTGMW